MQLSTRSSRSCLVNYRALTFRAWSSTCTVDGLDHFVNDTAPAAGTVSRSGFYPALCGHLIQVGALVSPPGPLCPRCAQLATEIRAFSGGLPDRHRRDGRLRRLLNDLWTVDLRQRRTRTLDPQPPAATRGDAWDPRRIVGPRRSRENPGEKSSEPLAAPQC